MFKSKYQTAATRISCTKHRDKMEKQIFKTEVDKIRSISNGLRMHQKSNGAQVILSEANKIKIDNLTTLLNEAANILETIN